VKLDSDLTILPPHEDCNPELKSTNEFEIRIEFRAILWLLPLPSLCLTLERLIFSASKSRAYISHMLLSRRHSGCVRAMKPTHGRHLDIWKAKSPIRAGRLRPPLYRHVAPCRQGRQPMPPASQIEGEAATRGSPPRALGTALFPGPIHLENSLFKRN
jgi:hypothetical protein